MGNEDIGWYSGTGYTIVKTGSIKNKEGDEER